MTCCAGMLVKDEIDIIEPVLRHLAANVDEIMVADNGSTDGTRELLAEIELGIPLSVADDDEPGHYQSRKITEIAMRAMKRGHRWFIPCDADEVWYPCSDPERRIGDYLSGFGRDIQLVNAALFDHLPTGLDPPYSNPLLRIGYHNRHQGALPKVACRLRPDLVIADGNHNATTRGTGLRGGGLCIRHFTWRSEEQYVEKIARGWRAFAATDLPEDVGAHWRMHGSPEAEDFEERVADHFQTFFFSPDPRKDPDLIYDPAPAKNQLPPEPLETVEE